MAVIVNGQSKTTALNKPIHIQTDYSCLTTDTKPTDCGNGSSITVLDNSTMKVDSIWYFHGGSWYQY